MTRENKLALVLGFGLMLFVGILVSDHLAARKAPAVAPSRILASNTEVVPPLPAGGGQGGMVLFGNGGRVRVDPDDTRSGAPPETATAQLPQQHEPSRSERQPNDLPAGGQPAGPSAGPSGGQPVAQPVRTYLVREGENFAAIARREYGRTSLGEALAKYNGVQPRALRAGASIKLPPAEDLDPRMASAQAQPDAPRVPSVREYTVQSGDSLFAIAERELGRGSRWEELKRFNQDVLKGRDALTPGMQIRIPVDA